MDRVKTGRIECAVAERTCPGEALSGDGWQADEIGDVMRVTVVDGLGHGPAAAQAAARALELVHSCPGEPLLEVLVRCHAGLLETRGVALAVADLDPVARTVTWAGVGNVTCLLARERATRPVLAHAMLPARGVLGRRLPPLTPRTVPVLAGDVVILATDGVAPDFSHELPPLDSLQPAAAAILRGFATAEDDALVVALRVPPRPE